MSRFKGPELRMPKLKVPPAVEDVFYDLHDRRLLPLVALVVVAIVAAPFLLSKSSSTPTTPAPASISSTASDAGARRVSQFTVTQVDPGLRVARKRLAKRHPKDPFVQKFTQPVIHQEAPTQESASASTAVTESPATSPSASPGLEVPVESSPPASTPPSGGNSGGAATGAGVVAYTWAIDLKITKAETKPDGTNEQGKPETRERILPPATLPAKKVQVATYIGVNPTTEKPLFLVSTDVTSVFGEGRCVAGTASCQLLELEPGFPETFVYGERSIRYKLNVESVKPVPVPQPAARPE